MDTSIEEHKYDLPVDAPALVGRPTLILWLMLLGCSQAQELTAELICLWLRGSKYPPTHASFCLWWLDQFTLTWVVPLYHSLIRVCRMLFHESKTFVSPLKPQSRNTHVSWVPPTRAVEVAFREKKIQHPSHNIKLSIQTPQSDRYNGDLSYFSTSHRMYYPKCLVFRSMIAPGYICVSFLNERN